MFTSFVPSRGPAPTQRSQLCGGSLGHQHQQRDELSTDTHGFCLHPRQVALRNAHESLKPSVREVRLDLPQRLTRQPKQPFVVLILQRRAKCRCRRCIKVGGATLDTGCDRHVVGQREIRKDPIRDRPPRPRAWPDAQPLTAWTLPGGGHVSGPMWRAI
ncbi:MAG: hypothetical protein KA258_06715 [Deltaproteobacteria bacterium]|nr:hypothetical protein [Deltaproteobacteria bacterium]